MEKRTILLNVLTFFLLIAIMIAGAVIAAGLVAVVAARFTQNIEILVTSSLIGVWAAEVIIITLRSRFFYNRKIKEIDESQIENAAKRLKKRYLIQIIVFAVFFGFVMYNQKSLIINSLLNETQQGIFKSTLNSPTFLIRIGIAAIIVIILVIRKIMQKHKKGNVPMPVAESQ
jgi:MFS family permease